MKKLLSGIMLSMMLLVFVQDAKAQDPHFSLFYASPLTLNPAMTGVFSGNYRFSGIYRGQWQSILRGNEFDQNGTPVYRTYSASFDMRTAKGFIPEDAFGIGVVMMADKAGAADYGTNTFGVSMSYLKALDRWGDQVLSLGVQGLISQRSISTTKLAFGTNYDGIGYDPGLGTDPSITAAFDDNFIFYDIGVGLLWFGQLNERVDAYAGFSAYHLNSPNETFYRDDSLNVSAIVPIKYAFHTGATLPMGEQTSVLPKGIFLLQGKQWEANLGADIKWFFDRHEPKGNAFYIGAQYRMTGGDPNEIWADQAINAESIIVTSRIDYEKLTFQFAYDINLGEINEASRTIGGFDIAASYVGLFKERQNRTLNCPTF